MENNNLKPKSIGGISFKDEAAGGGQQSHQSGSSYHQGENGSSSSGKNNNNVILWVILGVIALVIIIELVIVIGRKNDSSDDNNDKTTTEATTGEASENTTEADTRETTEETTDQTTTEAGYDYTAPTQLSGDWRDFQISINGVCYQFPFPCSVLEANGWAIDHAPTEVGAGETVVISATSSVSGKDFSFYLTNPHGTGQPIDNCLVTALLIENDCTEDEIKLADTLVFLAATKSDFKETFGAPDLIQEYEDMEYVSYYTDDGLGSLELRMDSNEVCYHIYIENMAMPEGLEVSTELPTEEPEINASYEAPTGPSTEAADSIITIDGYNYKLPCPVSEFTKNGWAIDSKSDEYVNGDSQILSAIEKDGEKIYCYITNYTNDTILSCNGMITMLDVYDDYAAEVDITFPGNIGLSSNASDFESVYSGYENYECDRDDEYEGLYYSVSIPLSGDNRSVFIWVECDYTTGAILEYMYEYSNY